MLHYGNDSFHNSDERNASFLPMDSVLFLGFSAILVNVLHALHQHHAAVGCKVLIDAPMRPRKTL
jgi:hypothetical protein